MLSLSEGERQRSLNLETQFARAVGESEHSEARCGHRGTAGRGENTTSVITENQGFSQIVFLWLYRQCRQYRIQTGKDYPELSVDL